MAELKNEDTLPQIAFAGTFIAVAITVWLVLVWREPQPKVPSTPTPIPTVVPTQVPTVSLAPTATVTGAVESTEEEGGNLDTTQTPTPSGLTPTPTEIVEPEFDSEVLIEAFEYAYNPAIVNLTAGDRVRITFKNMGSSVHNFVIDGLSVNSGEIAPGETKEMVIDIPINELSEYVYYCSIGNHRELGMEGRIIVSE